MDWSEPDERRAHALSLKKNLEDAERAASKWLKIDDLRRKLLEKAVVVLEYRQGNSTFCVNDEGGFTLCANDVKTAWAFLCRDAAQMRSGEFLVNCLAEADDADDSDYVDDSEDEDMPADEPSVDEPQNEDSSGSESGMEVDEELIVLGPDSEAEAREEQEAGRNGVRVSPLDVDKEMAESASLVANALLESVAPPAVFNQLQVRHLWLT